MVFAGLEGTYAVALTAPGYLQRLGDATPDFLRAPALRENR